MGTANRMDVRVAGDAKSLVAEMRAVEKENARLRTGFAKLKKTGTAAGRAHSASFAGAKRRASQLSKEIKVLEFNMNKSGKATAGQATRLTRLNKALHLTQRRMHGVGSATRGTNRSLSIGVTTALKFVSAGMGIMAVRSAWRLFQKDIDDSINSMKEFQNEFVNLQFLGVTYKDPKYRKRVHKLAEASGIAGPELAKGIYTLKSMTGYLDKLPPDERAKKRAEMLVELIKLRRTGNVPLPELVPTFAKMGAIYPNLKAVEQANITQFLLEKAAVSDPAELAMQAPRMFAAGKIGRIDARTAAAIGAVLTAKTGTTAKATTGMEMLLRKVMLVEPSAEEALDKIAFGKKAVGGRKALLKEAGVVGDDTGYQRLIKLAKLNERRRLSAQDLKNLFGERGMKYGQVLLEDRRALETMVAEFKSKTGLGVDIAGTKIKTVMKTDPIYNLLFAGERAEAGKKAAEQKKENLVWDVLDKRIEQIRKEESHGWLWKQRMNLNVALGKMGQALGFSVEDQVVHAMREAMGGSRFEVSGAGPESDEKRKTVARQLLGLDPAVAEKVIQNLEKATHELMGVAVNLNAATQNINPNAHDEN